MRPWNLWETEVYGGGYGKETHTSFYWGSSEINVRYKLSVTQLVKNMSSMRETWFDPQVGKMPWRRERLPTPVLWPGGFHGVYSPHKELNMTEWLSFISFPGGSDGKSACLQCGRPGFNPWVGKILWRRKWQPTPVLLPGKFHEWRNLIGYNPWGHRVRHDWVTSLSLFIN